ncbi:hypothetical protein HJG60_010259 [Phyllostomus discolor]|uniref:Uncharacterized protein n=1 Tax=Phyllostomus discolor TaxID=89673 RepID=A0A834EJT1_9CHIR|nr:hypothetical protein HJG60_010259 [Phyllostomus discolor]
MGQPASLLCSAVWGGGAGFGNLPRAHPISSRFIYFSYVTGSLLAIALVMIPRVGGFAYVLSLCGPFKWTFLRNWPFLPLTPPHWFLQLEVMRLSLSGTKSLSWAVWSGAGIACSQGISPHFYPPHVNMASHIPLPQLLPLHATLPSPSQHPLNP